MDSGRNFSDKTNQGFLERWMILGLRQGKNGVSLECYFSNKEMYRIKWGHVKRKQELV